MIFLVSESVPLPPPPPDPTAVVMALMPTTAYSTAFSASAARLRHSLAPSSSWWPKKASRPFQRTSANIPMPMSHSSTVPPGCSATCCIAPELDAEPSWSPKASCRASQPTSR